ncbi:hypothetical protein FH593_04390 [Leptospira interrogans]|nr:hypothetical protein [Leptospira interrogans]ULG86118.1 hypothetical protein FH594_16340 [Leptospira interrogans]ULG90168.1 hypothetical protein FH593_04390 [Leptospira interrogans]
MRIENLIRDSKIQILWRPFLLGPIFKAQCPRALPEARMCSKSLTECKKMEDSFFKTSILI